MNKYFLITALGISCLTASTIFAYHSTHPRSHHLHHSSRQIVNTPINGKKGADGINGRDGQNGEDGKYNGNGGDGGNGSPTTAYQGANGGDGGNGGE